MTDPFEPLRDHKADVRPPSVDAIRRRVERTRRRRQGLVGGTAGLVAVLAVLALVTLPDGGDESSRLAAGSETPPAAETAAPTTAPTPAPEARTADSTSSSPAEQGETRLDADQGSGSAATRGSGGGEAAADSAPPGPEALEVGVEGPDEPVTPGEEARFTLRVCNPRDDHVEAFFEDAQRYDFHVSRGGERVWTWSAGQAFAQVASSERWEPGACRTWTEAWSGQGDNGSPAPPGRYEVVGVLSSSPEVGSAPEEFCIGACA